MSCKPLFYATNTTTQAVAVGGVISPGTIQRRAGNVPRCCTPVINLNGNGITLAECGYYKIQVDVTDEATAAGDVTISLVQDGTVIESITGTAAAAGVPVNITIAAPIVRVIGCNLSTLNIVLTAGAGNITSVGVSVIKL